ncbi:MAG: hypothetical protein JJU28_02490 [Cyclobacteriaceae bacterium]|nr:hypothetical protein [Cyclobacteriaceae bacterium]
MNYQKSRITIHQPSYLLWGLLALAITELIRKFIRPYVWQHDIIDFGLLGCMPSFLYAFGIILGILGLRNWRNRDFVVAVLMSLLGVFYEFAQIFRGPPHTFDVWDVMATLSGGIMAFAFHKLSQSYRRWLWQTQGS